MAKGWGARKVPKQEPSEGKSLIKERWRMLLTVVLWFLLVFLALELHGVAAVPVGSNITLECGLKTSVYLDVRLTHGHVIAYGYQPDNQYKDRVHRSGLCDLTLEDVKTSDAGIYKMGIHGNGDPVILTHEICVNDTLTRQKGEKLVLGDLPRDTESVQHRTDTGRTEEVWKREKGVLSDRLTDIDGRLVIEDFGSKDTGEYTYLNKTGGTLVTLTVKESGTESKDKLDNTGTVFIPVWVWIVALVALALAALALAYIYRCK